MMERQRENTVVKQMRYASMGAWAVEQVSVRVHSFVHTRREASWADGVPDMKSEGRERFPSTSR
jgi:hypothetical protein